MDPAAKKSRGAGDRWMQAAHDSAMKGSTAAAKGGCLAAIGAGILSAGGAAVRGFWHGITGQVNAQAAAGTESAHALEIVARGVSGLFDAESLKTREDRRNLGAMENLANEIFGLYRNPAVPSEAKVKLDGWLRSAHMIVQKGRPQDADKELKALQAAVRELKIKPATTDLQAIHTEWQAGNRRRLRKEDSGALAEVARALIGGHPLATSKAQSMRGRAKVGDQSPNMPRPGSPPRLA